MRAGVYATELAAPDDQLAGWGIKVVMDEFAAAGRPVRYVPLVDTAEAVSERPRVWLVSLPYAGDAWRLRLFFDRVAGEPMDRRRRDGQTTYILGGHAVVNSDPFLDVADACFVGEADDRAQDLARCDGDMDALAEVAGVDTGRGEVWFQVAAGLSKRGLYHSQGDKEGVGDVRYLEVARGCKGGCRFCELGWAYGYTERTREETERLVAQSGEAPRSVVYSAPDTDGVRWLSEAIADGGYDPRWRSTRIMPYLRSQQVAPSGRRGKLRFGVEGITERLRRLTGKHMTDEDLRSAMQRGVDEGYRMLRLFFIGGLPTETAVDRRHMGEIMRLIGSLRGVRHWKSVDVKVTGLSPQPLTPWERLGVWRAIDAIRDYRRLRRLSEATTPLWRQVLVDAGSTEADVVKRMIRGELLPYLERRPLGDWPGGGLRRWEPVKALAESVGIDYRARVMDDAGDDVRLPWHRLRHPHEARIEAGMRSWRAARERAGAGDRAGGAVSQ